MCLSFWWFCVMIVVRKIKVNVFICLVVSCDNNLKFVLFFVLMTKYIFLYKKSICIAVYTPNNKKNRPALYLRKMGILFPKV